MSRRIKICSFNVRTEGDIAPNLFQQRAPFIKEILDNEDPDLIGFQEVSNGIYLWMIENLSDKYFIVGTGREKNLKGERTCIAYRKHLFEAIEVRNFMLSDTPDVFGSRYENSDQSICPRVCTVAKLVVPGETKPFFYYNTHLDYQGPISRMKGVKQILHDMENKEGVFILTGDMNAEPDSEEMAAVRNYKDVKDITWGMGRTFHNYGRETPDFKIDYIYTNGKADPKESYVIPGKPNENGTYPSDHSPVFGFIEIE